MNRPNEPRRPGVPGRGGRALDDVVAVERGDRDRHQVADPQARQLPICDQLPVRWIEPELREAQVRAAERRGVAVATEGGAMDGELPCPVRFGRDGSLISAIGAPLLGSASTTPDVPGVIRRGHAFRSDVFGQPAQIGLGAL